MGEKNDESKTVFRDPRIDKFVSWGLGVLATVVLSFGTYFIHGFEASLGSLHADVEGMRKDVSASQADLKAEIANLRLEIAGLKPMQSEIADLKKSLERIDDRVLRLERK